MSIKERFLRLKERIEEICLKIGRDPKEVKLLGASKKQSIEKIKEAYQAGLRLIGENYVQEARKKRELLEDLDLEWHFIGPLQRNKAKLAVKLFDLVQTVDRFSLVKELNKRAQRINRVLPVFIEVNIGGEESKAGVLPDNLFPLVEEVLACSNLTLQGLMTIPPYRENPEEVRPFFISMRNLWERVKTLYPEAPLTELSMGMSDDFEIAIEEGATIVRIGTALFGPRPY